MTSKQLQLKRHKTFATGLLLLMAAIYIACLKFLPQNVFTGYLSAFSEAAMVGALADWFAVTALFRHPLGLPIPHTNLIENSKKRIGDNLGSFITENFLTPDTIRPRLKELNLVGSALKWLNKPANNALLIKELVKFIGSVVNRIEARDIQNLLSKGAEGMQDYIKTNQLAGNAIEALVKQGYDQQLITKIAHLLEEFIAENIDIIKQKVKDESSILIPGFVDNMITKKITNAALDLTRNIQTDPDHKMRKDISNKLLSLAHEMRNSVEWEERFKSMGKTVLSEQAISDIAEQIWNYIQNKFNQAAVDEESALYRLIEKWITTLSDDFMKNEQKKLNAEKFIQLQLFKLILKHKSKVAELISEIVGDWKGRALSDKLELEVGKDLQFIRINGTIVGGLVGVIIHFLSSL